MALLPECLVMQTGCATPKRHKAPSSSGQLEGIWEAGAGADTFPVFHLHRASSVLGITETCPSRTSQFLWGPCHLLGTPLLISPPLELQIPWNRSVLLQWFSGEMEDVVVPLVPHPAEGKEQLKECSGRGKRREPGWDSTG